MALPSIPGVFLALALVALSPAKEDPGVPKEFRVRMAEYLKARQQAIKDIPAVPAKSTPEQIHAGQIAMFQAVHAMRPNAQQGSVFTADMQEFVVKIVQSEMKGKDGQAARGTTKQGNPAMESPQGKLSVKVNAAYPEDAPLSSVPPTLLLRLPQLPKELDYRFIGRHLILRDTGANMIVDYIPNVVP